MIAGKLYEDMVRPCPSGDALVSERVLQTCEPGSIPGFSTQYNEEDAEALALSLISSESMVRIHPSPRRHHLLASPMPCSSEEEHHATNVGLRRFESFQGN